jgi:hypothetical protein
LKNAEHVEQLETGGTVCRHCGGGVDAEGYATGGQVGDGDHDMESELEAMQEGDTGEVPQQYQATVRMREAGFADAVRRRRKD